MRLLPGVLGNSESTSEESHSPESGGLLEYPQYTRPVDFRGEGVPAVLKEGNHRRDRQVAARQGPRADEDPPTRPPRAVRHVGPADQGRTVRRLAVALAHHPVLDGQGAVVTSAVTNLDVHDLSRSARSYGCSDYFVIHPIAAQRELVTRIRDHWIDGSSGRRIPDRREAIGLLRIVESLDAAIDELGGRDAVEVWTTAALQREGKTVTFGDARHRLAGPGEGRPQQLVFGTGWGLAPSVIDASDALLEPIRSPASDYNHLSVRSACAIALDRLRG